ncbi:MAG TPA: molybdopterin dinucleotide binding domain-containing protein, partial [Casimicrobiaceae bacterium]|nr:molybdopterin dinucleotide binding domain-containing protein [Casimicrobiaceae bacterium]
IMKLLPGYYNLGQPRKITPKPDAYLASGYAAQVRARYRPLPPARANGQNFMLTMGQLLYHSGKLSTRASGLIQLSPNTARVHLHPEDVKKLGIQEGDRVRLVTANGNVVAPVQADYSVGLGSVFFPEHFSKPAIKDLMPVEIDPATRVPYFKLTAVKVERA